MLAWDHWVPGENEAFREIVTAWGKANNVDVMIDFQDDFDATLAKEASERRGHDFVEVNYAAERPELLEPLDDIVQALAKQYGPFSDNPCYMAQHEGAWLAVPTGRGSLSHPMASRLDLWNTHPASISGRCSPMDLATKRRSKVGPTQRFYRLVASCMRPGIHSATRLAWKIHEGRRRRFRATGEGGAGGAGRRGLGGGRYGFGSGHVAPWIKAAARWPERRGGPSSSGADSRTAGPP
jgi:hypothetical protein